MAATVNELLADAAIHHAVDLAQYSTGVVRRIIALLNRTDADLFAQLTAALGQMDAESFTVERLEAILQSVRSLNAQAYQRVEMALTAELRSFVEIEWPYQQNLFPSVGITMQLGTTVSAAQVYSAAMSRPFQGRLLSEWSKSIEVDRMVRIRDAIRIGFVEGQTNDEIVKRIRGTKARGYSGRDHRDRPAQRRGGCAYCGAAHGGRRAGRDVSAGRRCDQGDPVEQRP
jgi:hypothetical protein